MRHASVGFTLVDLMTATAIASVLAALAVPAWRSYGLRSHRSIATAALVDFAVWQEANFAQQGRYAMSLAAGSPADAQGCVWLLRDGRGAAAKSGESIYRVCLAGAAEGFVLEARPVNGQARDTECGTLSLDHTGARGATGPAGARCWR